MLELTCFTFPASEEKNNRKDFYWSEEAAAVITCHIITVHSPPDRQLSAYLSLCSTFVEVTHDYYVL